MAYFPNGTSGLKYLEEWCSRCIHWKDTGDGRGEGCPVMDFHVMKSYDWCNDKEKRVLLDMFIPITKDGFPDKCNMFVGNGNVEGQQKLF